MIFFTHVWILPRDSSFLPQSKRTCVSLIGRSKLSRGVSVCTRCCLSLCVSASSNRDKCFSLSLVTHSYWCYLWRHSGLKWLLRKNIKWGRIKIRFAESAAPTTTVEWELGGSQYGDSLRVSAVLSLSSVRCTLATGESRAYLKPVLVLHLDLDTYCEKKEQQPFFFSEA